MNWEVIITAIIAAGFGGIVTAIANRRKVAGEARREVSQGDLNTAQAKETEIKALDKAMELLYGNLARIKELDEIVTNQAKMIDASQQQIYQLSDLVEAVQNKAEFALGERDAYRAKAEALDRTMREQKDWIGMLEKELIAHALPFPKDNRNNITPANFDARLKGVTE